MKALKKTIGGSIVLAVLAMNQTALAGGVDAGSVQAALDNARLSGDYAGYNVALSHFYQNESMAAQWDAVMASQIAEMAGETYSLQVEANAPFLKAQRDIQTSLQAIALINQAKGENYPQLPATAAELSAFKQALSVGEELSFLESLADESSLMARLHRAERRYDAIVSAGGWSTLDGTDLMLSDTGEGVRLLKQRLEREGYSAGDGELFDMALFRALEQYQQTQGLAVSGEFNKTTKQALNIPAWKRLQTIRANIARFEDKDVLETNNHLVVNIPAFSGAYFNAGKQVWQDRVIVGKKDRRTPEIDSKIKRVVFNPAWYVPSTIAYRDVIPRASRDPNYWSRMGYQAYDPGGQVYKVSADATMEQVFSENRLRIKQSPGPRNALGQVKFLFPNKHAVYLHDTPNKNLFNRDVRTFSSGCVRVHNPLKLAEVLFQHQAKGGHKGIDDNRISQLIAAKRTRSYTLNQPVAVSTIYLTAEPMPMGRMRFHPDVYRYDTAAMAARATINQPKKAALQEHRNERPMRSVRHNKGKADQRLSMDYFRH